MFLPERRSWLEFVSFQGQHSGRMCSVPGCRADRQQLAQLISLARGCAGVMRLASMVGGPQRTKFIVSFRCFLTARALPTIIGRTTCTFLGPSDSSSTVAAIKIIARRRQVLTPQVDGNALGFLRTQYRSVHRHDHRHLPSS